jgi:hypothetical protein
MSAGKPLRIRLTDEEKLQFKRVIPISELEVRMLSHGQHDLRQDMFMVIKKGLERFPDVSIEHQEYTNTTYDVYENVSTDRLNPRLEKSKTSSYRLTQMVGKSDSWIKKTKISPPTFFKSFSCFDIKCAEAAETTILSSDVDRSRQSSERFIVRDKMTVRSNGVEYTFDVSVVKLNPRQPSSGFTYEIEMELPLSERLEKMTLADYAMSGISILLDILFEEYQFPSSYFIPERALIKRYTDRINQFTPFVKKPQRMFKPPGEFDINVRNDPINLKVDNISQLDGFAMTNKLDGERRLMAFFESQEQIVQPLVQQGSELMVLNPSGYNPSKWDSVYCIPTKDRFNAFLFDTEYYQGKFHVFDVIQYGVEKAQIEEDIPHQERIAQLDDEILKNTFSHYQITIKQFYYGTLSENLEQFIRANPAETFFRHNDGLIFTQKEASYRFAQHYKYKFPSKMSIDFKLEATRPNKLNQMVYNLKVTQMIRGDPGSAPRNEQVWFERQVLTTFSDYTRQSVIMECVFQPTERRWVALRERADKEYPNGIRTANSVWEDIKNPIPFSTLLNVVPLSAEKTSYVQRIQELDDQFLSQHFMEKKRYLAYSFDMFPDRTVDEIPAIFGIYDPGYKAEIGRILIHSYMAGNVDKDILRAICRMTTKYRVYGNDAEASYLETTVMPYLTTPIIFDVRTFQDIELCRLGNRQADVLLHFLERILVKDSPYVLSQFNEAISRNPVYSEYTTVDLPIREQRPMEVSASQSTLPWMVEGVSQAFRKWISPKDRIVDATAHIGVDSILLANLFPTAKIDAFEIDPVVAEALARNIQKANKAIRIHNNDSAYCVYEKWTFHQYDVIYIDAPRSGKPSVGSDKIELYLQPELGYANKNEDRNIRNVARYIIQNQIAYKVIIKVPATYNVKELQAWFTLDIVEISQNGATEYLMIQLTPLAVRQVASSSPVTVWSIPYVDDYKRLFNATSSQKHLFVRYPTNLILGQTASLFYQYLLQPFTASPLRLMEQVQLEQSAAMMGYKKMNSIERANVGYIHFTKSDASLPIQSQAVVEPMLCSAGYEEEELSSSQAFAPVAAKAAAPAFQPKPPAARPVTALVKAIASAVYPAVQDEDQMKNMKKYHNEEKRKLIDNYCKEKRVLDLGAGYGGDLHKYSNANVTSLVLVEPNKNNIESVSNPEGLLSRRKYMLIKDRSSVIHTVGQDTDTILSHEIVPHGRVNVVASFFSMTFLFESRETLRGFLTTVQASLLEGGYFIGTMMSGEKTMAALRDLPTGSSKRYGPAQIVKQYSDDTPIDVGMKLWINIEKSIVINQDEYLSFFSILREEAARMDLVVQHVFDFNPDSYHAPIEETEKEFSRLNIGFVFRKMPKSISSPLDMLVKDIHRECINLYGEDQIMIRTGVEGDGSCLYHAYLYNLTQDYRKADPRKRTQMVSKLRSDLSSWATNDIIQRILVSDLFISFNGRMNGSTPYWPKEDDRYKAWFTLFPEDFPISQYPNWYNIIVQAREEPNMRELLVKIEAEILVWCDHLRSEIKNVKAWADNRHIMLMMEYTNVNIYIISSTNRRPITLLLNSYKVNRIQSTVLLAMNNLHYEPMAFMVKNVAKRVMKPFDTNLIYLHHTLMKQNR